MGLRKEMGTAVSVISSVQPKCSPCRGIAKEPMTGGSLDLTFLPPSICFQVLRDFVHRMLPHSAYRQQCPLLAENVEATVGL